MIQQIDGIQNFGRVKRSQTNGTAIRDGAKKFGSRSAYENTNSIDRPTDKWFIIHSLLFLMFNDLFVIVVFCNAVAQFGPPCRVAVPFVFWIGCNAGRFDVFDGFLCQSG